MEILTSFTIGLTFAVGIYQILRRNVIRAVIGLMLITNAINLFLLTTGAYTGRQAPYVGLPAELQSDALPQALILTAVVISLGVSAFVLAMILVTARRYDTCDSDEIRGLKR